MSKMHIFIDGSWLFRVCQPYGVLSAKTICKSNRFFMNFGKLNSLILNYIQEKDDGCTEIGDCYFVTSIFQLPADLNTWPARNPQFSGKLIQDLQNNVHARTQFASEAIKAGYKNDGVFSVPLKEYILENFRDKKFQEKMVDTTVVALLVKYAITIPGDYYVVIAGDSDMLPAIRIAYPEFSKNVLVCTSHPDEMQAFHRQTAYSLVNFPFEIEPCYLQDHITEIMNGSHLYECKHCHLVFDSPQPLKHSQRPYCPSCMKKKK